MSNHFPDALADFQLNALTYSVSGMAPSLNINFGSGVLSTPSPVDSITSLVVEPFDVTYDFPGGDIGEFDQDTVEAAVATVIDTILTLEASILGVTLAEIQATYPVTIQRNWTFNSASQPAAYTWQDTLTYPPAG